MSYSIAITGHKDFADSAEAQAFENEIADKAAAFVKTIEGVTQAAISGAYLAPRNLLAEAATPEPGASGGTV